MCVSSFFKKNAFWLSVPVLALPALWSLYSEGLPRSFDGGLHMLRLSLLDYYLGQGVLLPRWTPSLILGYGYPLFNFYAPGSYYLAELLHLLGLTFYKAFRDSFSLVIILAGFGMYWLARDIFDRSGKSERTKWAALTAATAYMYGPYLLTNVYIRGALAESAAQALIPWIFLGVRRLWYANRPDLYLLLTSVALGTLAFTHVITLLFVPPFLLAYLFLHWHSPDAVQGRFSWLLSALLLAMGVGAFFWLPLLFERHYLAETAYEIAQQVWLPRSVWSWQNFLDRNFFFQHTSARPIRLGIVQVGLALLGCLLARRRDREWLFWLCTAFVTCAMISRWALPLWQSNDILSVAQFAWRLLSILSLPLALFVGGATLWSNNQWIQATSGIVIIAVVILAQTPRLHWKSVFAEQGTTLSHPTFAQIELEQAAISGGEGNSTIQEFRPRWADRTLLLDHNSVAATGDVALRIEDAQEFGLSATVTTLAETPLRFSTFYFPGWHITIDGEDAPTYPTTNLGLLTTTLPAGTHKIRVQWAGTWLQQWASFVSLITVLGLALFAARRPGLRWAGGVLLVFPALFVVTTLWSPTTPMVKLPAQPLETDAIQLLGFRTAQPEAGYLQIMPYWYVRQALSAELRAQWQLVDDQGTPISEVRAKPYFNTMTADNWPKGTLVDDAYRLPIPGGSSGHYQLRARLTASPTLSSEWQQMGEVWLEESPMPATPAHRFARSFVQGIELVGYDLQADRAEVLSKPESLPVVKAGQYLSYTLYWRANVPAAHNYHSFIHLTNKQGFPLVQNDQLPGPLFHPPLLWNLYRPQSDTHLLRVPGDAPSGLYWPKVGLYEFGTLKRLKTADGKGDLALPLIKILGDQASQPQHAVNAQFGEIGVLVGYSLERPAHPIRPGTQLQLTLYYRSQQATSQDYTRFVQLYSPNQGMAAQQDSPPQEGNNPTWAWQPGEYIADSITIEIAQDATSGSYNLYTGFYDSTDGTRLPIRDQAGVTVPEAWVKLTTLQIE